VGRCGPLAHGAGLVGVSVAALNDVFHTPQEETHHGVEKVSGTYCEE